MAMKRGLKGLSKLIDIAKEELPIHEEFLEDLKKSIERETQATKRQPSLYYKPSSMNCIRNMYYQRMGQEPDPIPQQYTNIGICNSGTDTHLRVQTYISHMKDYGYDCEYVDVAKYIKSRKIKNIKVISQQGMETKLLNTAYNISFLCDGILKFKGKYYILEIKTEASFKWNSRQEPAPEHTNQVSTYSLSTDIPDVIFLYINRDTLDMKSYLFTPTDDMKINVIGLIENCEGYVKRRIAPPKPADVAKKTCEYCAYKNTCRKEG